MNLPMPMPGYGKNSYQLISLSAYSEAVRLAWKADISNEINDLDELNQPPVRKLLVELINFDGLKCILISASSLAFQRTLNLFDLMNMPIMDI